MKARLVWVSPFALLLSCSRHPAPNDIHSGGSAGGAGEPLPSSATIPRSPGSLPAPSASSEPYREDHMDPGLRTAPVRLTLHASPQGPDVVELTAHVEVSAPMAVPAKLTVVLPPGANLVKGNANDSLSLSEKGPQTRSFRIHTATPLSTLAPIRITLDADEGAMGFHAEKQWPEQSASAVPSHTPSPSPPGGRPPGRMPLS